jgi:hypothetical protein
MASVIHDLATYLQSYSPSLSLTIGTNLFRFDLTPTPDAQVALIPYQGMEGEGGFGREGVRWEYPRVQVVCRGAKDANGRYSFAFNAHVDRDLGA